MLTTTYQSPYAATRHFDHGTNEHFLHSRSGNLVAKSSRTMRSLLSNAFLRAPTPLNAINAFHKTGLYPLHRTKFREDMFAATLPTSHDAPHTTNTAKNNAVAAVMLEMGAAMENIQQDFVRESTPEEQIIGQNKGPSTSSVYNIISPETIAPYLKTGRVKSLKKKSAEGARLQYLALIKKS
ncbi:hypothetical protein QE152_g13377 [Popillia japonica]|uniref:Uncharacterized protein n=1 Tax=Popillia japonica TaxID=7064 RepID=A0AAW1LDF7_POPJA